MPKDLTVAGFSIDAEGIIRLTVERPTLRGYVRANAQVSVVVIYPRQWQEIETRRAHKAKAPRP